jgi:hypothetical protein
MPRGSRNGSVIRMNAKVGTNGGTLQTAGIIVRKRYTDLKGRRREKKRCASTLSEARRLRREIEREIDAELAGIINLSQASTFTELVGYCQAGDFSPAEELVALLMALEAGVRAGEQALPQMSSVRLADYCNAQTFKPTKYFAAIVDAFEAGMGSKERVTPELEGDNDRWSH